LAGTFLLRTWVENHGPQGVIVPMALAEGVAMLGCVASALAGQAAWAVGLGIMAIVVIVRMQTAGLGSGPP
ncbi:MAG: hypothetical protein OEO23_11975, partial [Gemmatimonadota bacterium]|nr:hypothetical protein [Gemmatimonadota bacterium]